MTKLCSDTNIIELFYFLFWKSLSQYSVSFQLVSAVRPQRVLIHQHSINEKLTKKPYILLLLWTYTKKYLSLLLCVAWSISYSVRLLSIRLLFVEIEIKNQFIFSKTRHQRGRIRQLEFGELRSSEPCWYWEHELSFVSPIKAQICDTYSHAETMTREFCQWYVFFLNCSSLRLIIASFESEFAWSECIGTQSIMMDGLMKMHEELHRALPHANQHVWAEWL